MYEPKLFKHGMQYDFSPILIVLHAVNQKREEEEERKRRGPPNRIMDGLLVIAVAAAAPNAPQNNHYIGYQCHVS